VPEPCPDQCSGNGDCVNQTCASLGITVQTDNSQPCLNTTNDETTAYCNCHGGFSGANCGASSGSSVAVVAGISAGIIVLIVLAGVVVVVVLIFSAKKTVDWIQLRTQANADFHNNPMHEHRDKEFTNPGYEHGEHHH